jgi:predicted SAM-dependent methyltransferase
MVWKIEESDGNETGKVLWELPQYTRGRGIDVGCGAWKAFPHFIGVDNYTDQRMFGTQMKPDVIANADDLALFADGSMDFVYSSHLLEHLEDTEKTLREWWRVIKVGGHLCLYLPHKLFYPNIGVKGANPDHKHDFMPDDIVDIMKRLGSWDLVRNEDRNGGSEYSFFQVYKKL